MSLSLSLSLSWMMDLYALCFEGDCEQKGLLFSKELPSSRTQQIT